MNRGQEFLRRQIVDAVTHHHTFLGALEDHEAHAGDERVRELCTKYIPLLREQLRQLEGYQRELGSTNVTEPKRFTSAARLRALADTIRASDFQYLANEIAMASYAEETFLIFRDAGNQLRLSKLSVLGDSGCRLHGDFHRDASRLIQQLFVERVGEGEGIRRMRPGATYDYGPPEWDKYGLVD